MDSLTQVNTLNLIYTFLYQNDLYQSIDLHDYFGKENKIFNNPNKYPKVVNVYMSNK